MKNKILALLLLSLLDSPVSAYDKTNEVVRITGSDNMRHLVDRSPQEIARMLGRKPFLSYAEKEDGKNGLYWTFLPKDCDKCGEWVNLHPTDKSQAFWLPSQDCSHRNIVMGAKTYIKITVEFHQVGSAWVSHRAEYHYLERID